jgi:hypothetical protein
VKVWKLLVGLGVLVLALTLVGAKTTLLRSAGPVPDQLTARVEAFNPAFSAGLFIGIQKFDDHNLAKVDYAVDDAVDFAYAFALERPTKMMEPSRVVLALSGVPRKLSSRQHLEELRSAGAAVIDATQSNILEALQHQANAAAKGGLLIVTLATHGYSEEGTPYILASSSTYRRTESAISLSKLFDTAAATGAGRSFILVDACRERLTAKTRAVVDRAAAAPFVEAMNKASGQAILWAAAPGGYAYDDPTNRNGAFSRIVLEGLQCKAATDERGYVTFDTLADYVEPHLRRWINTTQDKKLDRATQRNTDGDAGKMPLVRCGTSAQTGPNPDDVTFEDDTFEIFQAGRSLEKGKAGGTIRGAYVADLDGDGINEVIVGTDRIIVFDANLSERWSGKVDGTLTDFLVERLVRGEKKRRQVAALFSNGRESRLAIFHPDGRLRSNTPGPGHLRYLRRYRETIQHGMKLLAYGTDGNVLLMKPNKGEVLWSGMLSRSIAKLALRDYGGDGRQDIDITTPDGSSVCLDAEGATLSTKGVSFSLSPTNRR